MEAAREAARSHGDISKRPPGDGTITAERLEAVYTRLEQGQHFVHACWLEGLNPSSVTTHAYHRPEVKARIEYARSQGALRMVEDFRSLIEKDKKSARILLDFMGRMYPQVFAEAPRRIETTGADGGPITHVHTTVTVPLTQDEAVKRLEVLRNQLAGGANPPILPAETPSRATVTVGSHPNVGDSSGISRDQAAIDAEIVHESDR